MIELPEAIVISKQLKEHLKNKRIINTLANKTPHKFAWYYQDPANYPNLLNNETIEDIKYFGGLVVIETKNVRIVLAEGVNIQYFLEDKNLPTKHQLYIEFDDGSALVCTIRMYGGMWAIPKVKEDELSEWLSGYINGAINKPNPLSDDFTVLYFNSILQGVGKNETLKSALAIKGRIPGLGNGVLHDILYHARLHPKTKVNTLTDDVKLILFNSIKTVLENMVENGGRDNETDIFNKRGNYKTLSYYYNNTTCPICLSKIIKEQYMGGSIYYCNKCQPL